jgi:hypothetical protein
MVIQWKPLRIQYITKEQAESTLFALWYSLDMLDFLANNLDAF